jgi:hypothetical protein
LKSNFFTAFASYRGLHPVSEIEEPVEDKYSVQVKLEIQIKGRLNKRDILNSVRDELDQVF